MPILSLARAVLRPLVVATMALGSLACLPSAQSEAPRDPPPALPTATLAPEPAAVLPTVAPAREQAAPAPTAAPPAAPSAPLPTLAAGPTAAPPVSSAELARIEAGTSEVRELQPRANVEVEFMDRPRLRQFMTELFERDYLPEERESDQRLLTTLGYVQPDQSVMDLWLDLYEDQVMGLYDDETKRMYVIADRFGAEEKVTYAHEYVHALQDQYFDLATLSPDHPDNYDRALAIHALVEGDATLGMSLYAVRKFTQEEMAELSLADDSSSGRLAEMPLLLQRELIFPYSRGLELVRRLYTRGGFEAVNAAFADPPQSTEQVLHLDKYDSREPVVPVDLPDLGSIAGEGWQRHSGNTLGELYLQVLVEQFVDQAAGERAAAGWGGDQWQLLTRGEESALVVRTVWDSADEAREFHTLYASSLEARFPDRDSFEQSENRVHLTTANYWIQTTVSGNQVDLVFAPDAATGKNLTEWLASNPA